MLPAPTTNVVVRQVISVGSSPFNGVTVALAGAVFAGAITMTAPIGGPYGVPGVLITSPSDVSSSSLDSQAAVGIVGRSADGTKGPFIYFGSDQFGSSTINPVTTLAVGSFGFSSGGVAGGLLTPHKIFILAPCRDITRATDIANITALYALGCKTIILMPFNYWVNSVIVVPSGCGLIGAFLVQADNFSPVLGVLQPQGTVITPQGFTVAGWTIARITGLTTTT